MEHPGLQYRVKCRLEIATVEWHNGYPGEITLSASLKSDVIGAAYEGSENVVVAPGATTESTLETMACYPDSFRIRVTRFVMAPPPVPPPEKGAKAAPALEKATPPLPLVPRYVPPVNAVPDISPEALATVVIGMPEEEVSQKLGPPLSKLTLPEPGELIETLQYHATDGKSSIIRFSNGVVTGIRTR